MQFNLFMCIEAICKFNILSHVARSISLVMTLIAPSKIHISLTWSIFVCPVQIHEINRCVYIKAGNAFCDNMYAERYGSAKQFRLYCKSNFEYSALQGRVSNCESFQIDEIQAWWRLFPYFFTQSLNYCYIACTAQVES